MSAGLRPYPAYKDSGVAWLGDVPAHWELRRGKSIFDCIDVRSTTGEEELLTVSSEHGVIPRRSTTVTMFKAESYVGYKLYWPGDLVINSLWAWARGLGVSRHHGIVSSAYGVYRLRGERNDSSAFIHQLVRSVPFQWELQVRSKGIWISRLQLTDEAFLDAPLPLPPRDEQGAIVRYLDYVDARIRRYVRAKRRLTELLTEQKQALIHEAVTGRVDVRTGEPYAAYKPSGVEWLGDVPAHWEVLRLKYLFKEIDERSQEGLETLLSLRMYQGLVPHNDVSMIPIGPTNLIGYKVIHPGYLVMNRMRAALGMFGIAHQMGIVSPDYAIFRTIRAIETDYYLNLFKTNAMRRAFRTESKGLGTGASGFLRLYSDRFGQIQVPLPPTTEQTAILAYIADVTRNLTGTIERTQTEIDLIREYRTRLIADMVTGKLDVREAAARLPVAEEEQGAIEETELDDEASVAEDFETMEDEGLAENG